MKTGERGGRWIAGAEGSSDMLEFPEPAPPLYKLALKCVKLDGQEAPPSPSPLHLLLSTIKYSSLPRGMLEGASLKPVSIYSSSLINSTTGLRAGWPGLLVCDWLSGIYAIEEFSAAEGQGVISCVLPQIRFLLYSEGWLNRHTKTTFFLFLGKRGRGTGWVSMNFFFPAVPE